MTSLAPMQASFNAGELGRRLGGRPDTAAYQNGVAELVNLVPLVQGPALKRSGTRLVQPAKAQASRGRLIAFEASVTQAYIIEASHLAFRFYTNNGRIETSPGVALEVATPYTTADLARLDWHQSNDVLYLVDGRNPPHKLSRTGAASFVLAPLALTGGPFADQNTDRAITVYASAGTGSVTLTASAAIFVAGHIGALFYLELGDFRSVAAWEPGISVTLGALRRNEGHVYEAVALPAVGARTGTSAPVHVEGRERDGMGSGLDINAKDAGGVVWEYRYGKFGIARITAVASATAATATVVTTLPDTVVGAANASWRWALPQFSDATGWPAAVTVWNQRLTFGTGNAIDTGVVGDYLNFAARNEQGEQTTDQALSYRLPGADPIQWLAADRQLLAGTLRAEYALGPSQAAQAVSATNINAPVQSFYGSAKVRPAFAGTRTLFVQRAGRKLRELGYDFNSDRYGAPDLTVRHPAIAGSGPGAGFVELAVQSEPEGLVWAVRADGVLAAFTYAAEQEVKGWSRHVLGGWADAGKTVPAAVESVAVIPAPDGSADDLWLLVRRWAGGGVLRTVERLDPFWREGGDVADGFFVDCGLSYAGAAVTTLGGLGHLRGETVTLLVDGATHPDLIVSPAGTVTLANGLAGSNIHAGLRFTARLTTMKLDAGGGGTVAGKLKRIVNLTLRLLDALGVRTGTPGGRLDEITSRKPADAMDSAVPLFSGDRRSGFPGGWDRDGVVTIESRDPLPLTIVALMPEAEASRG